MSRTNTPTAGAESPPSPLTFSSFTIGLATQALMFLGAVADPRGGEVRKNPAEAAAIIGVIEMLAEKTRGNLSEDEAKLVEEVLFELRMRYVNETRRAPGQGEAPPAGADGETSPSGAEEDK